MEIRMTMRNILKKIELPCPVIGRTLICPLKNISYKYLKNLPDLEGGKNGRMISA